MRSISRPAASTAAAFLGGYAADARRYDELLDGTGAIRPQWKALFDLLGGESGTDLTRRGMELTRRLITENGVTYNVYADPKGADRPWALDPLPLMIGAAEWRQIEQGVAQRARVLDALLADLYGPQRLISEGVVPPELPFGHPNFLWPAHGIVPPGGTWLHIYAVDLARAPDGRWWVLADRTQSPSGAGYALENREIIEQVLPDPIRDLHVCKLRGFFTALRLKLLEGVDPGESPLAVVLTPGPFNETYFEHAYLARQLGITLSEGTDLTVRNDTVYLKTLAGLKRVHAILRRLDDDYCDPLELRSDSALGVPGLLGAVRAGRVVLANALGTGVLESAAWLGFHPGVSQRLLGETLTLPSVATWWCGEAPALEYVLEHLDELVIKPAYPNQRFEPVFGRALVGPARDALITRLRTRPYAYVAQEHVALSQAPVLRGNGASGFAAKAVTIRVYAFATGAGRVVMPGGLARVATDASINAVTTTQRGGASKDIWVLPDPQHASPLPEAGAGPARTAARQDLTPSRLVENLYWMGRYTVRCEDKAQLLHATLAVRVDPLVWRSGVRMCQELDVIATDTDPMTSLNDEGNPQGLVADIRRLNWCASQVRGRLSFGCWQAVSSLQQQLHEGVVARESPRRTLDRLLLSLAALAGFALDDMTQDAGWRLLRIGRRLERLQFVARLLSRHLSADTAKQHGHVEWLLSACDSLRIYRPRYVASPRLGPALDLLIRDAEHPRALAFQWQAIARDMHRLVEILQLDAEEVLGEPIPALTDSQLMVLEGDGPAAAAARAHLASRLQRLANAAGALSDRLSMRHFSHTSLDSQALAT
ncbi:MAG TPA: circularly permuted type 2 ATP-grasp protein [Steroidobacteraceae bacterium]|nr:circularly permuted type 2 ATP-grasp protein [Steroidobacteraceae bacterium]